VPNALYSGHNLVVLRNRKHFPDQSADLIYLDSPFSDSYNVRTPIRNAAEAANLFHFDATASALVDRHDRNSKSIY
jgi:hypothetical protein